jgi:hypothetical protein
MDRRVAVVLAGCALAVSGVGSVSAGGPTGIAAGSFTYHPFGRPAIRSGSIAAIGSQPARGMWSWQDRHGPITCLVIAGADVWLAGPGTTGPDTGVFIHVHDGGNPGPGDDLATAFGQDPGQPLEELLDWCETRAEDPPLFPMDRGDVTVRELL